MRKLVTILCLTAFIALQYGRLISYWHCRYMVTSKAICDCEKIFAKNHQQDGSPHAAAAPTVKLPVEETWFFDEPLTQSTAVAASIVPTPVYNDLLPEDHTAGIFQPPRVA